MGKAILIIVAGTLVVLGMHKLGMLGTMERSAETSVGQFAQKQSRLIATSMVNMNISKLSDNPGWRQYSVASQSFFDGTAYYRVIDTVFEGTDVVKVTADGLFFGVNTSITAFVKAPDPTLHPFLRYAILGGMETKLDGKYIDIINGTTDPSLNANIHSNDKLTIQGEHIKVEGFGTYVNNPVTLSGGPISIKPNSNPDGLDSVHQAPVVDIPNLSNADFTNFKNMAHEVHPDGYQITGDITLGTSEDPKIIYVTGKLFLKDASVTGYGIILADNDVQTTGQFNHVNPDPNFSEILIATKGKFMAGTEGAKVNATIYSKKEISSNNKNATFIGGMISLEKVTLNQQPVLVKYKPLLGTVYEPIFGQSTTAPTTRLEIVHWQE